jgi:tyrosyl-tRNA synthetase
MKSLKKPNKTEIKDILDLGTVDVIERAHLEKALVSGKELRVKFGIDPTSRDLHLGHAVVLRKLKQFQDLGHNIVLIIGDFTGMIGDPTGKSKTRSQLTAEQVHENMEGYLAQAFKIIDITRTEVHHNSEWLSELKGGELFNLLSKVSVSQVLERDVFVKRIKEEKPIFVHELLYPIMQAYDSVRVEADLELGGTDQTFNILMGRTLMEKFGMAPQDILTVPLLEGTDGKEKMSKSLGNYIGITDAPNDMFGKIMSIPDSLIVKYFTLCTNISGDEIKNIETELKSDGFNPRDAKARLAREIVKNYHNEKFALSAEEEFNRVHKHKEMPNLIDLIRIKEREIDIVNLLVVLKLAPSKSQARSLVIQGGVKVDGRKVTDPKEVLKITNQAITIQVGKLNFISVSN